MSEMEHGMTPEEFYNELEKFTKDQYLDPDPLSQEELEWLKFHVTDSLYHQIVEDGDYRFREILEESGIVHLQAKNNPYLLLLECLDNEEDGDLRNVYVQLFVKDAVSKGCRGWKISQMLHYYRDEENDELPEEFIPFEEELEDDEAPADSEIDEIVSNLKIPLDFEIDDGRIYALKRSESVEICPHLIAPIAIYTDIEKETEQIEIAYKHDGEWHTEILSRMEAYDPNKLMSCLLDKGVEINRATAPGICIFLQRTVYENRADLPKHKSASRLGWCKDYSDFVPYSGRFNCKRKSALLKLFQAAERQEGTLEDWLQAIKMIRYTDSIQTRVAIAASFASVLIRPAAVMPFMVNIWGAHGCGKTTLLMAAASVWADPRRDGYINNFDNSATASKEQAAFCCDLPLMLDEMQTRAQKSQQDFDTFVYTFSEGKAGGRATSTGEMRESAVWYNTVFVTGEQPIVTESSMGGAQRRVIILKIDKPIFTDNQIGVFKDAISQNYGSAGRAFIKNLMLPENLAYAKELVAEFSRQINEAAPGAQNHLGAVILAADTLAAKWVFRDDLQLTVEDIAGILKTNEDINTHEREHESIRQWILRKQGHFMPFEGGAYTGELYGRYYKKRNGDRVCAILSDVFDDIMRKMGFKSDPYLAWAVDHHKISIEGNGRRRPLVPFGKDERHYCVCIIVEDDPDDDTSDDI